MFALLKANLRTKKCSLIWNMIKNILKSQIMFEFYLNFNHSYELLNQDHYSALNNGDPDATNNTSGCINHHPKEFATSGKKICKPFFGQYSIAKCTTNYRKTVQILQEKDRCTY